MFILRVKEQESRLTLQEHDGDDDKECSEDCTKLTDIFVFKMQIYTLLNVAVSVFMALLQMVADKNCHCSSSVGVY